MVAYWNIKPDSAWVGNTAFVIGGGPSLTPSDIESVRGRRAVAVNQSYLAAPWADYLFYADQRWWERESKERMPQLEAFEGTIVTTCTGIAHPLLRYVKRQKPDENNGISLARDTVAMERTSVQGAMNLCYHLGAKRIVLLGVDNRDAPNGRQHHHDEYPWVRRTESWEIKGRQFGWAARALARVGVEVINCSPVSTLTHWPIRPLAEVLKEADHRG